MMACTFPPSPALSNCDSLADIDDLEAYLSAQGPLSRFATPPRRVSDSKDAIAVQAFEVLDDDIDGYTFELLGDDLYDDEEVDCMHQNLRSLFQRDQQSNAS